MNINDQICTPSELKQFACEEDNLTTLNFSKFIESKSGGKYTVIEKKFIKEILIMLDEQLCLSLQEMSLLTDSYGKFTEKWHKVIKNYKYVRPKLR